MLSHNPPNQLSVNHIAPINKDSNEVICLVYTKFIVKARIPSEVFTSEGIICLLLVFRAVCDNSEQPTREYDSNRWVCIRIA